MENELAVEVIWHPDISVEEHNRIERGRMKKDGNARKLIVSHRDVVLDVGEQMDVLV